MNGILSFLWISWAWCGLALATSIADARMGYSWRNNSPGVFLEEEESRMGLPSVLRDVAYI
jgi:hypothetical protein